MTRKQRRAIVIALGMVVLAASAGLVLNALSDKIVFFYSPSDIAQKHIPPDQRIRLGGLVEKGSVVRGQGTEIRFKVTDTNKALAVRYKGVLPDLFREGQGVVTEGHLGPSGVFIADSVLAKHDENYMPPEVAAALKKQGVWQETAGPSKGTSKPDQQNGAARPEASAAPGQTSATLTR